jgi:hypothetical protein
MRIREHVAGFQSVMIAMEVMPPGDKRLAHPP